VGHQCIAGTKATTSTRVYVLLTPPLPGTPAPGGEGLARIDLHSNSDVLDNPELLTWFLAHDASPNAASQIGRTPFMAAVAHAPLETVQLLRAHGADAGNTLPSAARSKTPGRLEVVCLLLDTGAPIDAVEYEHNALGFSSDFNLGPAVDLAVCYNSDEMLELLLERGARMEIVDYFEGRSVLQLATDFGSPRKGGMQMDLARGSPGETAEEVRAKLPRKPEIVGELYHGAKIKLIPVELAKQDVARSLMRQKLQKL
jgi:hypothetical protein